MPSTPRTPRAIAAMLLLSAAGGKTQVQWLGQAAFKITTPGGKVIVVDPCLKSNPKTPAGYKKLAAPGDGKTKVMAIDPGAKLDF